MNQADNQEQSQQVALMRDIYRQCTGVLIWLGSESAEEERDFPDSCSWLTDFSPAFDSPKNFTVDPSDQQRIEEYLGDFLRYYRRPKHLKHSIAQDYELGAFCMLSLLAQNKHLDHLDMPVLWTPLSRQKTVEALRKMMEKIWWGRQWVIQETVLAPTALVHHGRFLYPMGHARSSSEELPNSYRRLLLQPVCSTSF
jgi:hypothetical protein